MGRWALVAAFALTAAVAAGWLAPQRAEAVNKPVLQNAAVQRGRDLVRRNCAGCHSVGLKSPSLAAGAPPFRELGDRYTPEALRTVAAETATGDHYGMPAVYLSSEDARAIEAFLTAFGHADKATRRRLALPSCFLRRC